MGFWNNNRIAVSGGDGFLGSHIVQRLQREGCCLALVARRRQYDVCDLIGIRSVLNGVRPDIMSTPQEIWMALAQRLWRS